MDSENETTSRQGLGPMAADQLHSLERVPSHSVRINGDGELPASLRYTESGVYADSSLGNSGSRLVMARFMVFMKNGTSMSMIWVVTHLR